MVKLSDYSIFTKPELKNPTPVSFKDIQKFNIFMKEVVKDYKIKHYKSIESARNIII